MGLYIRMVLYAAFAGIGGMAVGSFEPATGNLVITVNLDDAVTLAGSVIGYLGTFAWSRKAKAAGGAT